MLEYLTLCGYGDFIELDLRIAQPKKVVEWSEENFTYVKYNPRKNINRFGLSITSLDGGVSGRPDLDSFWTENPEDMPKETDINVPTPVYKHPEIKKLCDHFQPFVGRSHFLKIPPGGYFPPHRDFKSTELNSYRIIVPMLDFEFPNFTFMLEDKILQWQPGQAYFLNTAKAHHLFNCGIRDSYWIVLNIQTTRESVMRVIEHMKIR
tara:strand:- start:4327 stop:4947 length:621 start_codon:yes stop_codon:yes gene_type:complete